MARAFAASYHEIVALADGTEVELRFVRPEDKPLFVAGFAGLSLETRYLRFFSAKPGLTAEDLRYLTEVDGERHVAIVAVRHGADGDEGLGVARFIALADDPTVAEAAVVVVDAWQRKGLGGALLRRLRDAAIERGVTRLRGAVLAKNREMIAIFEALPGAVVRRREGPLLEYEVPLVPPAVAPPARPVDVVARILSLVGKGELEPRAPGPAAPPTRDPGGDASGDGGDLGS